MLILNRKVEQEIILTHEAIKEPIVFSLQKISGSYAKIGIEAPDDVRIVRSELLNSDRDTSE